MLALLKKSNTVQGSTAGDGPKWPRGTRWGSFFDQIGSPTGRLMSVVYDFMTKWHDSYDQETIFALPLRFSDCELLQLFEIRMTCDHVSQGMDNMSETT